MRARVAHAESFELVWNTRENLNLSLRKGQDFPSVPWLATEPIWNSNTNIPTPLLDLPERNQSLAASAERERRERGQG